ncbi:Outer membrane protein OmpA [Flexibacter flexilis DSM 6793]|uniref:Outer membrane protein OmpA n=1 Tax=Flexibacter flexilis DSM 6793 TaxID=927664 RepID=A0A1I1K9L5_9BACT|nr:Outer membrane protein OmpA [Flexibacter flexilis DSM 6793]
MLKYYIHAKGIILLCSLILLLTNTSCNTYHYGAKTRGWSFVYRLNPLVKNGTNCHKMAAYGGKAKRKKVKGYEPPGGMKSLAGSPPIFNASSNSNPLPQTPPPVVTQQPNPTPVPEERIDKSIPPPDPTLTKDQVKNYKKLGLKPKVVLQPVYFETNSGVVDVTQTAQFSDAMQYGLDGYIILVEGHTDDVGTEESNDKLSQKRVDEVQNELTIVGVPADRIQTVGYGERQPIVPNTSAANRKKNRRVQFLIF